MRAQMNAGKLDESEKVPLLQRLLQYRYAPSNVMMPDHDIISEAMGHMFVAAILCISSCIHSCFFWMARIAASDTTSTTLSYFFWELSRREDILKRLQDELDVVMPDSRAIPDISVLQRLPYLNAFIKEGTILAILCCLHL